MTLTLEAPDTVHAGEPIVGTVRSTQRVCVFVRRLAIWRQASGPFPSGKWVGASVDVSGDAPFTLPPLDGPLTYRGERVEIQWSVVAESLDGPPVRAEVPFVLVAPRAASYELEAAGYRDAPTETTTLEPDLGDQHVEGPRRVVNPDAFEMVGAWVARTFAAIVSRRGVSDVTLAVTPSRVRAGDELVTKLAFTTREELVIESITIQLAGREHLRHVRNEEAFIDSRVETITERVQLAPGPHTYETRLRVPSSAPPSFASGDVAVEWFVRATIQVDGSVDEVSEFVIGVAPF